MDETARAIARDREESRAPKSPGPGQTGPRASKSRIGPAEKITARQKPGGPVVNASTKRPKMGGGA